MTSATTHFHSPHVRLIDYVCRAANRIPGPTEEARAFEIVFMRRGSFTLWTQKRQQLVTPNEVVLIAPGVPYAASHPLGRGDECTVIACSSAWIEPELRESRAIRTSPAVASLFLAQAGFFRRVAGGLASDLEIEEAVVEIVAMTMRELDQRVMRRVARATAHQRRYVRRAQEYIAANYTGKLSIPMIAREAGVSMFHLSRLFRLFTGCSLHRYQTGLRLRGAMTRILEGDDDIGQIAIDNGFSSHSHFTRTFSGTFGIAPTHVRERRSCAQSPQCRDSHHAPGIIPLAL